MKYMGSKNRIAKYILPIILKERRQDQWYVEPFVGGANMIDKVKGNRIGADNNKYLIECLKKIRDDPTYFPKNKNETDYKLYQKVKKYGFVIEAMYGYYGFALSYGGKWFGGWCRDKKGNRDHVAEAFRNALKQSSKLKGIKFICSDYQKLNIPENSIIYCDPPYAHTTAYKNKFDHNKFWQWCRDQESLGHSVFISEYSAPSDFKCIWSKEIVSSLTKNTGSKRGVEKLFVLNK